VDWNIHCCLLKPLVYSQKIMEDDCYCPGL
jgi:hypothetical protein